SRAGWTTSCARRHGTPGRRSCSPRASGACPSSSSGHGSSATCGRRTGREGAGERGPPRRRLRPALAVLVASLAAVLVSMLVFALARGAPRDKDAEQKGSRFLLGAGDFLVHWLLWGLGPVEGAMRRRGA